MSSNDTHSNPISRVFSKIFHRDEPQQAATHTPQQVTPRVVSAPQPTQPTARQATPTPTTVANTPSATPATPSAAVAPTPTAQHRTYTVQTGDSLSKIAQHLYGDANRWHQLYEANRATISDPDRIYPGQVLTVPDQSLH
ncbi:LysM peptidoglycan-binding domain-containing protein [Cognatilysobacter terrigena]|uniref:LysM peptidoglycan-binding domain-containing protein n=1 Tax=Cognatilysobacter terrigena TaxID=2488749 RepID=UPI001AACBAE6|nr:LysM peptidoglycan-binding domain-containing protein [Lysobacter terrigena]